MKQITDVIKLITDKYLDRVNVVLNKEMLSLEYLYYINGEQDVFKIVQITENDNQLYAKIYPETTEEIITIKDLEDIFTGFEKELFINKSKNQISDSKIEQEQYQEYLNMIDKIFNIDEDKDIDFSKLKFLNIIFEHFAEDLYSPSEKHNKLRREYIDITNEFRESLTDGQTAIYEKISDLNSKMTEEIEQQLFIFGFVIGCRIKMDLEMK
ncbi:MAG: hypothetical protein IJK18_04355 [Clostridia bacterium]|nr:hypothetical protein [Clostridia bacterium]